MKLYLVQHGEAKEKADDPDRRLTEQGRHDVGRVAGFAGRAGVEVHEIRHSGKRRAEETAALLAKHLVPAPRGGRPASPAPNDDVRTVAELLKRETRPLRFVGHQPFLERLAGLLVAGDPDRAVVRFQRGGLVCLERDPQT